MTERTWEHASPSRKDKCAGNCGEPLRGSVVRMQRIPGVWHVHCALTRALDLCTPSADGSTYLGRTLRFPDDRFVDGGWSLT